MPVVGFALDGMMMSRAAPLVLAYVGYLFKRRHSLRVPPELVFGLKCGHAQAIAVGRSYEKGAWVSA